MDIKPPGTSSPIVRWIRAAEDGGPRLAPGQPHVSATEFVDIVNMVKL